MFPKTIENTNTEAGFTLIELLVVILIIGILTSITVPAFLNQHKRAIDANTESDAYHGAVALSTTFLDEMNALDASTTVEGYAVSPGELVLMDIEVGSAHEGQGYTEVGALMLKQGTRGAVGGSAGDFSVCYWNPNGKEYHSPTTAAVWRSIDALGGGTFRSAHPDDDCVAVAERMEEEQPPPTEPPSEDDDTQEPPEEEQPDPDDNPPPFLFIPGSPANCVNYEAFWIEYQRFFHALAPGGSIQVNSDVTGMTWVSGDKYWDDIYENFPPQVDFVWLVIENGEFKYGEVEFDRSGYGSGTVCRAGSL